MHSFNRLFGGHRVVKKRKWLLVLLTFICVFLLVSRSSMVCRLAATTLEVNYMRQECKIAWVSSSKRSLHQEIETYVETLGPPHWVLHESSPPKASSHTNPPDTHSILKLPYGLETTNNQLTIVTAYFNLGTFNKGDTRHQFSSGLYRQWMAVFGSIHNPLIVFVDSTDNMVFFQNLRRRFPSNMTTIKLISREELWAFRIKPRIADVYSQWFYPRHSPNTVIPEYSCAMHAKYECMLMSILLNPHQTKYFSWLDIGYFRNIPQKKNADFQMILPAQFDERQVAYNEVYGLVEGHLSTQDVFYQNLVWVGGGYFVAKADVMFTWIVEYLTATDYFLRQRLMNTDQQVILAMQIDTCFNQTTSFQLYKPRGLQNRWFYLGYISKRNTEKIQKVTHPKG